jgi:predicted dehydrogenase
LTAADARALLCGMARTSPSLLLLLLGCGAFGRVHLAALARLGLLGRVVAHDPVPAMRAAAEAAHPGLRFVDSVEQGLDRCRAVIIATPPETHAPLAEAALRAGRDLFLEKPATVTAKEAERLAALAELQRRVVQVGLYFRYHPKTQALHGMLRAGEFGRLHHLSARMSGVKRARADSGALLNDAVHFCDLIPWLAGEAPRAVFATVSDPLRRGHEDFAVLQLLFPSGATALIEAGCVVPGEHADAVVPGAETRKLLAVAGSDALAEIDYAAERFWVRRGRHRPDGTGAFLPDHTPREDPGVPAADPVEVVAAQLSAFLDAVATRRPAWPGLREGGVAPARLLDAARRSAQERRLVEIPEASG